MTTSVVAVTYETPVACIRNGCIANVSQNSKGSELREQLKIQEKNLETVWNPFANLPGRGKPTLATAKPFR